MRLRELPISVATILALSTVPAFAGPKGAAPKSGGPKTTQSHGSPKTVSSSPKTTGASSHGAPKTTTTHGSPKTTTTTKGSPKSAAPTTTSTSAASSTSGSSTSGSSTTTTTTTTTTAPEKLNPIAQKISTKTQLNSKVTSMLPTGVTLNEASKGFKNQGQFIAALHVSQNLGIPFADLKTAMTGITPKTTTTTGGTTGGTTTGGTTTGGTTTESQPLLSLGQAIKKLRPGADAQSAESTATKQATVDLGGR